MNFNEAKLATVCDDALCLSENAGQSNKRSRLELVKKLFRKCRKPIVSGAVGPIKFVIINTGKPNFILILVLFLGIMTQLSIGAVNIMVLGYGLKSGDTHAILCTVGWHFFCTEAVMAFIYGRSCVNILYTHRKIMHYVLNLLGLICSVSGALLGLISGMPKEPHGLIGLTAIIMTVVTAAVGPLTLLEDIKKQTICILVHSSFAIITIIFSAICLTLGLLYTAFKQYCGNVIAIILVSLVSFYTLVLIILACKKMYLRIKYFT